MSTLYQSSKDVPTGVLSARLVQLSDVVSRNRERIDAEFTMRIPAEVDRDADLVMSEAAVRLEALQAECEKLRSLLRHAQPIIRAHAEASHMLDGFRPKRNQWDELVEAINAAIDAAIEI